MPTPSCLADLIAGITPILDAAEALAARPDVVNVLARLAGTADVDVVAGAHEYSVYKRQPETPTRERHTCRIRHAGIQRVRVMYLLQY